MTNAELIFFMILAILIAVIYVRLVRRFTEGWIDLKALTGTPVKDVQLSVVIPFRNETQNIPALLDKILSQDYPADSFEIILVNDHSSDGSEKICGEFVDKKQVRCFDLPPGSSGKKSALQYGISHANGTLIVTTDADCIPGRNWLKSIASFYRAGKWKMISGPVAIEPSNGLLSKFQSLEFISLVASGAGAIGSGKPIMCNGANLAYERSSFEEVEGFSGNEHIRGGDDIFLLEKFKRRYGKKSIGFIKDKAAIVRTGPAEGLWVFFNQRIRWVAKSPAYRDFDIIFTAMVVLLVNLGLLAALIWGLWSPVMLLVFAIMFLTKCLADLVLLWKSTAFFGQQKLMLYYLPFQFVYFIFIGITGIGGNLLSYKWKGR